MSEHGASERMSWSGDARQLARDALDGLQLRRELLETEVAHDFHSVRRLVIVGGLGAVLILTGLPVLLLAAAHWLSQATGLDPIAWSLILSAVVVVPGAIVLGGAVRRFNREFSGLRHSLAELQEDFLWLREWVDL